MKKICLIILLIFFVSVGVKNVNAFDPISGSTNVGGQIGSVVAGGLILALIPLFA